MTVIHGPELREIGITYKNQVAGPDGEWYLVTYKVVKEATKQDLLDYIQEMGCIDTGIYGKYFYFVQMD